MANQNSKDAGAHFHRCDFQVHTPRDNQWSGNSPADEAGREEYARTFVAACRERSLTAVAITDHHDFLFFPYIKAAAASELDSQGEVIPERDRLTVFPGLELTLGTPTFQALLVLDAAFPVERLDEVLGALSVQSYDLSAAQLPSVTSIDHVSTPKELHEVLDTRPFLRGRYIVLPNVTDKGYKTMLRKGMKVAYREMPCVGGYLDGTVDKKVGTGNATIFAGRNEEYGNKKIALFQTSDSRSADFKNLGSSSTWVKWATPSAEALRQACLAQESRISQTDPELPNIAISRIEVSNSSFLGPVSVDFNAQYNAIIGGRGTGKSTILGYLRWALCDEPVGEKDSETDALADRQRTLIAKTLVPHDPRVEIHFAINEVPHVVRRSAASGQLLLKVGDGEFASAKEADIRALLPIHAYSQRQLSSVAIRRDELSRFITAPVMKKLEEIDRTITDVTGRLRENYATVQRVRALDSALNHSKLEIESLDVQSENLRKSLTGLSEVDQAVLSGKPAHDQARAFLRGREAAAEETLEGLANLVERLNSVIPSGPPVEHLPEPLRQEAAELDELLDTALQSARASVADGLQRVREVRAAAGDLGSKLVSLERAIESFEEKYDAVKKTSTAHEAKLAELAQLEDRTDAVRRRREKEGADRVLLGDPLAAHDSLRTELASLTADRSSVVEEQCQRLGLLSEDLIKAELRKGVGLEDVRERFRAAIVGSSVKGAKTDALFDALGDEPDPLSAWSDVLTELEKLATMEEEHQLSSSDTPVTSRLGFSVADQERVRSRLTTDGWLDLALTPVVDEPRFLYRVKEADYIDFSVASAGQQATALLIVLLAQPGMPLLIDQPEDDLDSQVVLDIVKRLWKAKGQRQLLFASHNANLVVNGDAELVVVCENRTSGDQSGGVVSRMGAIDMDDVRSSITTIMEGGAEAFKLRKEKYNF